METTAAGASDEDAAKGVGSSKTAVSRSPSLSSPATCGAAAHLDATKGRTAGPSVAVVQEEEATPRGGGDGGDEPIYDVAVIGGGVVGLAVLRHATLAGYKACVVEREPHLAGWASAGNSGIACTGVDAPVGSLERSLIREAVSTIRTYCVALGVPFCDNGSLVCSWPWSEDGDLGKVLAESHTAGDTNAALLSQEEVRPFEPTLSKECLSAVHIPGEIVLDPWLYTISLAVHARENGADIYTDFEVDAERSSLNEELGLWTLLNKKRFLAQAECESSSPLSVRARSVVNASGLWADLVHAKMAGRCCWKSMPRRGQFLILSALPSASGLLTRPIQPVPTQRTKGIFVFPSLYGQIIVGPTAADQESRFDREPDDRVRDELLDVARRAVPSLLSGDPADGSSSSAAIIGEYVGIRPATDLRDYQIRLMARRRWVTCAGIRSTGLTASLAIGRHVVYLLEQDVLAANTGERMMSTTPLPPVEELISDYCSRGDGSVTIHAHSYRVTHPLTALGWQAAGLRR